MAKTRAEWAQDSSLFFRLQDSVHHMIRSGASWSDRAKYAFERLRPITPGAFPDEERVPFDLFKAIEREALVQGHDRLLLVPARLSPKQRDAMVQALLHLYESMVIARS